MLAVDLEREAVVSLPPRYETSHWGRRGTRVNFAAVNQGNFNNQIMVGCVYGCVQNNIQINIVIIVQR